MILKTIIYGVICKIRPEIEGSSRNTGGSISPEQQTTAALCSLSLAVAN